MVKLDAILDRFQLERDIRDGWVDRKMHPNFPSVGLICYSHRAQIESHWTPETRAARGLIYDLHTLEVFSRPLEKFFNYGQKEAPAIDLDAPIVGAFNKWDGSLVIAWRNPDGEIEFSTKGSFRSDQAIAATTMFHMEWEPEAQEEVRDALEYGFTWLGELIGPSNRIVLSYPSDMIVPLGVVENSTGNFTPRGGYVEDAVPR